MRNWILRASALTFAAALSGAVACSGSGGGCGGANTNTGAAPNPVPQMTCGAGTQLVNNQCVVVQTNSDGSSGTSGSTQKAVNQ
ncbi:MAG: hypothetical protein KGM24_12705 [Elusimicrobia bacterium]|nr:hypothetical protein [Elusimicrobiota bacterium]